MKENLVVVSGLGFTKEFDLFDMFKTKGSDYITSQDFDSPYCHVWDSYLDYKNKENPKRLTYGGYLKYNKSENKDAFFNVTGFNNLHLKCTYFTEFYKLLPEEVISGYEQYLLFNYGYQVVKNSSPKDTLNRFKTKADDTETHESEMCYRLYKYLNANGSVVNEDDTDENSLYIYYYNMAFAKMCSVYVAEHLNVPIKSITGSSCVCDSMPGQFSSRYRIALSYKGKTVYTHVEVKSNNFQ